MNESAFHILNRGATTVAFPVIEITPMALTEAASWQTEIMAECQRRAVPSTSLAAWLKNAGLLSRCCFLSSGQPGEPLGQYFVDPDISEGVTPIRGCPALDESDELGANIEYAQRIGLEYAGIVDAGRAVFNRVTVWGGGVPFTCSHLLYGWEESGRRIVLSAIDVHTLH